MATPSTPAARWTFKDSFKTYIPTKLEEIEKPERDVWTILCEKQLEEAKERCDAWKDEIQNLLVFAGLFSAIVTTFVVDSYKNTQPDSQATTVLLLAQLVEQLAPQGVNNSIPTTPIPPFTPDQSELRVNVYWFLSLVISLGTASAGIAVLQWIREFHHYDFDSAPKEIFALRSLRSESFDNWQVSTIIATLPLLIQIALVLFLIGLSDFLSNSVSQTVAIPSIIVSGIIISFIIASIILPTVQHLTLLSGLFKKDIPTPCPYRSPAGWGYFRLIYWITTHVLIISRTIGATFLLAKDIASKLQSPPGPTTKKLGFVGACKASIRERFGILTSQPNYVPYTLPWSIELEWLLKRDDASRAQTVEATTGGSNIKSNEKDDPDTPLGRSPVEYDAARGLVSMVGRSFRGRSTPYALYHCFLDLPRRVKGIPFFSRMSDQGSQVKTRVETTYDQPSQLAVQAENLMLFLDSFEQTRTTTLRHQFAGHQLELFVRLLGDIFELSATSPKLKNTTALQSTAPLDGSPSGLWVPPLLRDLNEMRRLSSLPLGDDIRGQLLVVFENFISSSQAHKPLASINVYHTFQQIVPLTELISHVIQDTLRLLTSPADEDEQLKGNPRHQQLQAMIETTGSDINQLLVGFLRTDFVDYQPQDGECPDPTRFERATLYLTSTIYITNVLNNLKNDVKFHGLNELQDKTKYTAPKFVSSFVDLMNAWSRKTSQLGPAVLTSTNIFKNDLFLSRKQKEVERLCSTGPRSGGGGNGNLNGNSAGSQLLSPVERPSGSDTPVQDADGSSDGLRNEQPLNTRGSTGSFEVAGDLERNDSLLLPI